MSRAFTVLLGLFFIVEGIWGLYSPVVFGVLTTNHLHAIIHLVLGVIGLAAANRGPAPAYLTFVGLILIVVGGLWFFPAGRALTDWFAVNRNVACLNLVVGVLCLLFAIRRKGA